MSNMGMGANAPTEFAWQIGKTAGTIVAVKLLEEMLQESYKANGYNGVGLGCMTKNQRDMEILIEQLKSGKLVLLEK